MSPLDDLLFEPPERAILQLTPDPSYDITLDQAAVTIVDDELPAVTIVASDDTAAEAGLETGSFSIERTGPTSAALTVFYNIFGGATNGLDYETLSGSVTIPAGSATATIPIVPIDDSLFEDPESVILSLEANTAYQVVTPGIASVLIVDNDGAVVTIVATDPNASEPGLDPGEFTVTRTGGDLTAPLLLIISRSGTADNGSDYASLGGASFALTIPANETTAIVTITPLPDTIAEGDETVILTISPRTVYTIGAPGSATVVIAGP